MTHARKSRPGGATRAAEEVWRTDSQPTPIARCDVYAPSASRGRYLVVVTRCPHCSGSHQHFGATVADLLDGTRAGCGRPYRLHLARLVDGGQR